jgi:ketosteroid isomerase-like protein
LCWSIGYAQQDTVEFIKSLEEKERQATLTKDTTTLLRLWSSDFTVNAPMNRVVPPGKTTLDRPVITMRSYDTFERNVEHVFIKGTVAFSMGNETVVAKAANGGPGKTIKRRYTNIWMKENNVWKLTARHANVICESP